MRTVFSFVFVSLLALACSRSSMEGADLASGPPDASVDLADPPDLSMGDASLQSLDFSTGTLDPAFAANTTTYTLTMGYRDASVMVTATAVEPGASLQINGMAATSGATSPPIAVAGAVTPITIVVRSALGASKTYVITALPCAYLKASNSGMHDRFANVSVSGDTLVVGASWEASRATGVNGNQSDDSAVGTGAVYVFVRNGWSWTQQAYLKPQTIGLPSGFGSSVSLSGDTLAIGAPADDAVYIFVRSGTTWTQQAYLRGLNTEGGDRFGDHVSLSGDTVAVGVYKEASSATGIGGDPFNNDAPYSGAVYVFTRSGTTWSQQAYIKASNAQANDYFGLRVSLSGDSLAVGAYAEDSNATGVNGDQTNNSTDAGGAAYVFVRSGTTWTQQAYLKASNTGIGDRFGTDVSLSGDTLTVGADAEASGATGVNGDQNNNTETYSGAVYVFVRSGTTWSQQAYLKASNTNSGDLFGGAVALSGDTLVVAATGESSRASGVNGDQSDNSASSAGAAYVFVRSGTTWTQQAYLKASNPDAMDLFGRHVAVGNGTIAVGAFFEASSARGINGNQSDNSQMSSGAVYVFR